MNIKTINHLNTLAVKTKLLILTSLFFNFLLAQTPVTSGPDWTVSNLTANGVLAKPNTMLYGPDGNLWITEREGKKLVRVNPTTGAKTEMLNLSGLVLQNASQNGLMGMAIHPDLYADINTATNNYVYLLYTYDATSSSGLPIAFRIARYTYNSGAGNFDSGSATTIIDGIEANNDHTSGKIVIGADLKIYWTIGDFAANRGSKACTEIRAQYLPTSPTDYSDYKGKILRLNLDGSIPLDNPELNGVTSYVYAYGFRNAQGLVFGSNGRLYSSEHGDKTDDELNIIESGKNYGWPLIAGYNDDMGYAYCNWSAYPSECGSYSNIIANCPEAPIEESASAASMPNFMPPIGTYNTTLATEPTAGSSSGWPTVAPSSIDIYEGGKIPGWGTSLLIPTLKTGLIIRTKLNADGSALQDGTYEEFHSDSERFRDVALDPDGLTIYTITDNGAVIKLQFVGTPLNTAKFDINGFSMLPNPANNEITLIFGSNNKTSADIKIFDVQGRLVKEVENVNNNQKVSSSKLSNGVYFVRLISNDDILVTKRLVVKR